MDIRKARVLEAVVLEFIETGEPVGSRTISKKYDLGVSPATIRNEMADLEEMGFVIQPHTSAGRIPSDSGYRYYIEQLMHFPQGQVLADDDLYHYVLEHQGIDEGSRRQILEKLADRSGLMSFMVMPGATDEAPILGLLSLQHVKPGRALLVVLTDNEQVESRLLDIPASIGQQEIELINQMLNHYLKGLSIAHWKPELIEAMVQHMASAGDFILEILKKLNEVFRLRRQEALHTAGRMNLLRKAPEEDLACVQAMLEAVEEGGLLTKLIAQNPANPLRIYIGDEGGSPVAENFSILVAQYYAGYWQGYIGLIGPKRMDYAHHMGQLQLTAQALEEVFRPWAEEINEAGAVSRRAPGRRDLVRFYDDKTLSWTCSHRKEHARDS